MRWPEADQPGAPRPEQLAAYADGELDEPTRTQVAAWLSHHPEALAELEAQRQLARWWQTAAPPEPSEADWAGVLARIETALATPVPVPQKAAPAPRRSSAARWLWTAVASLAAAVLLLVGLTWNRPPSNPPESPVELAEPFDVVSAHEVEIISMEDADSVALVIGVPPVSGPIILASAGDILLQEGEHNMTTISGAEDDPTAPMILAPRGTWPDSEENR